ncbi:DNRLRE domain-containing protein [candidate division WOR-3 bacterium]|uniref:DNRLRE domain-containing protein n=1 Tax=candidate division WOR-3 bacterium TaxID=2052148 RepID=A0A937XK63_UNCW3|nr:DNRLRE domain-containing protein [candidate division WOR-3 bacterium]
MKALQTAARRLQNARTRVVAHLAFCILTCALSLFSSSCNTLPVGFDQLRDRVSGTADTTLLPDSASGYSRYVPLGGSSLLYLGRDADYVSRLALRFSILDTMSLDSVTSFQLVLHQSDTSKSMGFICRPCSSEWVESGVSWLMADSFNHWLTPGGDFLKETLATGIMAGDSAVFDFRYVGLDSALKATIRRCGVGIFPQDTGIAAIYSGASTTTAPRLRVTYTNKGKQTTRVINDVADASLIDTVATRSHPLDLLVGSGVAFRTWLSFNLDSIPAEATIARADLKFRPETKYHRTDTLVLGVSRLKESYVEKGANARYESLPSSIARYIVPADSDTVVTIDIRSLVQLWTGRSDTIPNHGLLITSSPEWSKLFRLRIPRSGIHAPRLELQYVLPPEDRFR